MRGSAWVIAATIVRPRWCSVGSVAACASVSPVPGVKDEDERDAIIRQLRAELRAERRRGQLMIDEVEQVVADQIREQVRSSALQLRALGRAPVWVVRRDTWVCIFMGVCWWRRRLSSPPSSSG